MDGFADTNVGATAANIAHAAGNVLVTGLWIVVQQIDGGHDLAALAVSALRNVLVDPGLLHGMEFPARRGQAFNGGYPLAGDTRGFAGAGFMGAAVDVNRARPATTDSTTELGAGQPEVIAKYPEQWCILIA